MFLVVLSFSILSFSLFTFFSHMHRHEIVRNDCTFCSLCCYMYVYNLSEFNKLGNLEPFQGYASGFDTCNRKHMFGEEGGGDIVFHKHSF